MRQAEITVTNDGFNDDGWFGSMKATSKLEGEHVAKMAWRIASRIKRMNPTYCVEVKLTSENKRDTIGGYTLYYKGVLFVEWHRETRYHHSTPMKEEYNFDPLRFIRRRNKFHVSEIGHFDIAFLKIPISNEPAKNLTTDISNRAIDAKTASEEN